MAGTQRSDPGQEVGEGTARRSHLREVRAGREGRAWAPGITAAPCQAPQFGEPSEPCNAPLPWHLPRERPPHYLEKRQADVVSGLLARGSGGPTPHAVTPSLPGPGQGHLTGSPLPTGCPKQAAPLPWGPMCGQCLSGALRRDAPGRPAGPRSPPTPVPEEPAVQSEEQVPHAPCEARPWARARRRPGRRPGWGSLPTQGTALPAHCRNHVPINSSRRTRLPVT